MRNKAVTYILIAVVLGVWGFIFYRVFNHGAAPPSPPPPSPAVAAAGDSVRAPLGLDYRDPFLESAERVAPDPATPAAMPEPPGRPRPRDVPKAKYKGTVAVRGMVYALIEVGQNTEAFRKGATIEGDFEIRSIDHDSVVLRKNGETHVLRP